VGLFKSKYLFTLKTGNFFGSETPMSAARSLRFKKSRFCPAFNSRVAHAAQTGDFSGSQTF
jgi:hypothetical protein